MLDTKLTKTLETLLYAIFFLAYIYGNKGIMIILVILMPFYIIVNHYDSKAFFNYLNSLGRHIKVEPKDVFTLSFGIVIRILIGVAFFIFIMKNIKINEQRTLFSELAFLMFPILLHILTSKINKAKGFHYISEKGIFVPSEQNTIVGWDEIVGVTNYPEKVFFELYLRNEETMLIKRKSPEDLDPSEEKQFAEKLIGYIESKINPAQFQPLIQ